MRNGYRNKALWLATAALAAAAGTTAMLRADEVSDSLRKAPPSVQAAVIQLAGDNKITEFDNEVEGGKQVYDLEYTVKGAEYSADIDPSGQILTREVGIDASILPPAVVAAAQKAHDGGKLHEPAIVTEGDKMYYEVEMRVGADTHEMQISPGGDVLADSVEAPEADEQNADKPAQAEKGEKGEKGEDKD